MYYYFVPATATQLRFPTLKLRLACSALCFLAPLSFFLSLFSRRMREEITHPLLIRLRRREKEESWGEEKDGSGRQREMTLKSARLDESGDRGRIMNGKSARAVREQ